MICHSQLTNDNCSFLHTLILIFFGWECLVNLLTRFLLSLPVLIFLGQVCQVLHFEGKGACGLIFPRTSLVIMAVSQWHSLHITFVRLKSQNCWPHLLSLHNFTLGVSDSRIWKVKIKCSRKLTVKKVFFFNVKVRNFRNVPMEIWNIIMLQYLLGLDFDFGIFIMYHTMLFKVNQVMEKQMADHCYFFHKFICFALWDNRQKQSSTGR